MLYNGIGIIIVQHNHIVVLRVPRIIFINDIDLHHHYHHHHHHHHHHRDRNDHKWID